MMVLVALSRYLLENSDRSPSFRELAEHIGARSVRTVTEHVHALRRLGFVAHRPFEARTLWITWAGAEALKVWEAPTHATDLRVG